ncbi:GSU2403 family nucleotidyltransferase fold protein [Actimicrobium antarcticum]|uniref:Nucleotidyltransferase-like domain-containing protein n=1 Tax=Actimicrobium antarcticum TaxID=1051899 RepID=A0ABP7TFR5_9BURK
MKPLFTTHPATIQTEFENVRQSAQTQGTLHIGTPGTIEKRERGDGVFLYHRYYDANGKPCDKYIGGPTGNHAADIAIVLAQQGIDRTKQDVNSVKMLRKLGFVCMDDKAGATLAALHNFALFEAGLTLIGSHAYGAILNKLGVIAQSYLTEDIDIVRSHPLHLAAGVNLAFLDVLKTSNLPFIKVATGLRPGDSAVTHKLPGAERLLVDLLVNGSETGKSVAVPELGVHAQAVPFMRYLVEDRMEAITMSKNLIVPVHVPSPERFAVHKMFSAMSRNNQFAKTEKDLLQAATLVCVLEARYPGEIDEAMSAFPSTGKAVMLKGAIRALDQVQQHSAQAGEAFAQAIANVRSGTATAPVPAKKKRHPEA